jgi:toxin ParE1/3/4
MKIMWSAQAKRDLRSIQKFIATDSEHQAQLQLVRLIERVEEAAKMPTKGHPVHEMPHTPLRETHCGSYRIIYLSEDQLLQVVTIIHMKQILPTQRLK